MGAEPLRRRLAACASAAKLDYAAAAPRDILRLVFRAVVCHGELCLNMEAIVSINICVLQVRVCGFCCSTAVTFRSLQRDLCVCDPDVAGLMLGS